MADERYSRFTALQGVGTQGLRRIREAAVAVVGLGGLGCVSATQLAALGVGTLRIVDYDVIDFSNLQRQYLFGTRDVGLPKVEVGQHRLQELNPDVLVEAMALSVTSETAQRVVEGMTVVVDGLDRFEPRYALNRACVALKVPYVFAGALGSVGNMTTIIPGVTPCLECVLGGINDTLPTCTTVGIHPSVLGVIASLQASEAIRLILGQPPRLADRLLLFDLEGPQFDVEPIARLTSCPVCGPRKTKQAPLRHTASVKVTELCTNETYLVHSDKPAPIDISRATILLKDRYPIIGKSALGVQIQWTPSIQVSVVGEGNVLVKGVTSPGEARAVYRRVLKEIKDAVADSPKQ